MIDELTLLREQRPTPLLLNTLPSRVPGAPCCTEHWKVVDAAAA